MGLTSIIKVVLTYCPENKVHIEWKIIEGDEVKTRLLTQHEVDRITKRSESRVGPAKKLPWYVKVVLKKYLVEEQCEEITEKSEA